jgi:hypothetical protein
MKKIRLFVMCLAMLAILFPLKAQDENAPVSLAWNGYILADDRAHVSGKYDFSWQEYRLDLKGELKAFGKAKFFGDLWIRSLGFPEPKDIEALQKTGAVSPQNISLREAYVDLYGLGFKDLDVTAGRQRIAWGTADRINPTDVINPYDLEDIWDFGRHLGSDGLKAVYYFGDFSITGIFVPLFKPSLLPYGKLVDVLMPAMAETPGVHIQSVTDTMLMPELTVKENSTGALKFGGRLWSVDFSLSYAYFRDGLPVPSGITLIPEAKNAPELVQDLSDGTIEIKEARASLVYPRLHMAGLDFSTGIAKLGVWGEMAVFFPEKRIDMVQAFGGNDTLAQALNAMPQVAGMLASQKPALDNKPYVKFVVGLDYTFPADIYINVQYIHGFVHERGDSIEDYLMANLDWNLLNNKLKLTPIGIGLEIKNFSKIADNYAVMGQPQIAWYPIDNAEIVLGARIIDGKEGTYFGKVKNEDEVFVRVKYSF